MKKLFLIAALCLAGCSDQKIQSAGTAINQSIDVLFENSQIFGQYLVAVHKITQDEYDRWNQKALLAVTAFKAGTMTVQQLHEIFDQYKDPEK